MDAAALAGDLGLIWERGVLVERINNEVTYDYDACTSWWLEMFGNDFRAPSSSDTHDFVLIPFLASENPRL